MGTGLVPLTTAYYLSRDRANHVKLLSENKGLPFNSKAQLDGPMVSDNFAKPMTHARSFKELFRSAYKADSPNFFKMSDIVFLPGALRFIRFWLSPWTESKISCTE